MIFLADQKLTIQIGIYLYATRSYIIRSYSSNINARSIILSCSSSKSSRGIILSSLPISRKDKNLSYSVVSL